MNKALLTDVQQKLYGYILGELRAGRGVPSQPRMQAAMGWKSVRNVTYHLEQMEQKGWIRLLGGQRGIELVDESLSFSLPVAGVVAAGTPLPVGDDPGRLDFQKAFGGDVVMYQVRGDSMIEAAILSGDYVAVRRDVGALEGQIVVAEIDGELTLKQYRVVNGGPVLYSRNRRMRPIRLEGGGDARLVGVLVGVIRLGAGRT